MRGRHSFGHGFDLQVHFIHNSVYSSYRMDLIETNLSLDPIFVCLSCLQINIFTLFVIYKMPVCYCARAGK